jgi:hypothetical protein
MAQDPKFKPQYHQKKKKKYSPIWSRFNANFPWKKKLNLKKVMEEVGVVVHTCNPCTREAETKGHEFQVSLDYIVSSRSAWAWQQNPVSKRRKKSD